MVLRGYLFPFIQQSDNIVIYAYDLPMVTSQHQDSIWICRYVPPPIFIFPKRLTFPHIYDSHPEPRQIIVFNAAYSAQYLLFEICVLPYSARQSLSDYAKAAIQTKNGEKHWRIPPLSIYQKIGFNLTKRSVKKRIYQLTD